MVDNLAFLDFLPDYQYSHKKIDFEYIPNYRLNLISCACKDTFLHRKINNNRGRHEVSQNWLRGIQALQNASRISSAASYGAIRQEQ